MAVVFVIKIKYSGNMPIDEVLRSAPKRVEFATANVEASVGPMTMIELDASTWSSVLDFYDALLSSLGAPAWHGRSIDALVDSIIGGRINAVEAPFVVSIRGTGSLDITIREHIEAASFYLAKARAETRADWGYDADATIQIVS